MALPARVCVLGAIAACVVTAVVLIVVFTATDKKDHGSRSMSDDRKPFSRLPKTVVPVSYNLTLKPDLNKFVFSGSVEIAVKVNNETNEIKLDSEELKISDAEYITASGESLKPEMKLIVDEERVLFTFAKPLPVGDGVLKCKFSGVLTDILKGFYRTKSKDSAGQDTYFAVTQFEPIDAHRAFPCWDEPAVKATFNITLVVQKNLTALSNMNSISETPDPTDPDYKVVKFETTPKMSTYLVAAVVGQYDYLESHSATSKIRVRVYTPIGKKEQGQYALDTAVRALDFYEDYFKIPYPLTKADFVAVADFAAGAMENWGLITCREATLLFDPKNSAASRKQRIAVVVTHELAHMWFGNLVTMEWWTHLWLNEGFARFMQVLCADKLYPEYDMWTQFVSDTLAEALELDALDSSHPIEVPIGHPSEVDEIFDSISYEKGASVIRMLYTWIGDENFRSGMQSYLKKHSYQNTFTEDLWRSLEEASKFPVESVMNSWVKQMGYPIVSVTSRNNGTSRLLELKQEKFYSSADSPLRSGPQPQWKVPVRISSSSAPNETAKQVLLESTSMQVEVEGTAEDAWTKVNGGAVGVYRSKYSSEMLDSFLSSVKDRTMPSNDRFILHSDLYALVQAGYVPTKDILKFTRAFENETDFAVWNTVGDFLSKMHRLLGDKPDLLKGLHSYGRSLYAKIFSQVGWDPKPEDRHTTTLLRTMVISKLVTFNDEQVLEEARKRFQEHISGAKPLAADLRLLVYRAMAKKMDNKTWETFMTLYKNSDFQEEANRISTSLGDVSTAEFIEKVLAFCDSDQVRSQDAPFVIGSVATSALGRQIAWDHYKANYVMYNKKFNSGFLISRLIKGVAEDFSTFARADEVKDFFADKAIAGTERTVKQTVETIILNAKWLQRDEEEMTTFFKSL